jgi:hypothetical protein
VYVSARIVSGAGKVAIGTAVVRPEKAASVALAMHAKNQGDETGRLDSWPGLEARIQARRRLLGSRFQDVRRIALVVDPRAPTRTTVEIEPRHCLDVFATPSEEVSSLELVAEGDGGRIVARAQSDGRDRGMVLCSATGDSATLALRPRGAPGTVALVVGVSTEGAEQEIERSVRVDRLSASLPLVGARRALAADLKQAGYPDATVAGNGDARVGSRAAIQLKLPEGCERLDVIAGSPLGPMEAAMWEANGSLIAEAKGGARATLYACGSARNAEVDVEAETIPGPFAV